ncbi:putative non-specific serine/threonine protein kinase [Rosa chinensis]|uniref:Putative non-specific serine/threonine protein kinase n=1 Tax=Rosa chinensis TaxID=74649 RepID=A0A2P6SHC6_ROSCH|nr:putative non-specific serine/threonine protein kinase [Rosa chinensis]
MGGVLVMKLVLIYSLVLNSMSIFCRSSMQLNHMRIRGNETDRLALLAIKAQIQHDPNQVTSSWNETLHFCLWYGITCSRRRQRVTKLELGSLALGGSISPHIGNLSFLRVIDLLNNSFTHQIPPQLGHLHRLQIPPSLGNLSSLEIFATSSNNLEGSIPSSLCQLRKLRFFKLSENKLSGTIPSCIYNLSGIVNFGVSLNQIQGSLPSNLGFDAFPNLQVFSNFDNQFTGAIPSSISNATNLMSFQCESNKHTGQVPNLLKLHKLNTFIVSDNVSTVFSKASPRRARGALQCEATGKSLAGSNLNVLLEKRPLRRRSVAFCRGGASGQSARKKTTKGTLFFFYFLSK